MKLIKCLAAVLGVVVALPLTCAAVEMRDGLWELTTSTEVPGTKTPSQTKKFYCYSKEDVKDQKIIINRNKNCTVTEIKASGDKISWKMQCTGNYAGTFTGETVFSSASSYESVMVRRTQDADVNLKVNGKRIGMCK